VDFIFYPARPGLRKVLLEWQELALRYVWEKGEQGVSSREVREFVLERQTERTKISRASIIGFLEKLRKQGVLRHQEEKWQGGHRKIYFPLMNEDKFVKHIVKTMAQSLMMDFPEETTEALKDSRVRATPPLLSGRPSGR
jgi:predicted transcriptional regulator